MHRTRSQLMRAFTLIELMVAISLLMVLGLMLITSLNQAIAITGEGAAMGDAAARSQSVMLMIERDLKALHGGRDARFVLSQDPWGRPWVGFVRTMPEERTTYGGYTSGRGTAQGALAQRVWDGTAPASVDYAALGGLCEVVYFMAPSAHSTTLYRGVRAPLGRQSASGRIGGGLIDGLLNWQSGQPTPEFPYDVQPVAQDVLYFGMSCVEELLIDSSGRSQPFNEVWFWESAAPDPVLQARRSRNAAPLPDRGLPAQVRFELTLQRQVPLAFETALISPIGDSESSITLETTQGLDSPGYGTAYVRIGDEWVSYGGLSGDTLTDCQRGARGTRAQGHPVTHEVPDPDWTPEMSSEPPLVTEPIPVRAGETFKRIVRLPTGS